MQFCQAQHGLRRSAVLLVGGGKLVDVAQFPRNIPDRHLRREGVLRLDFGEAGLNLNIPNQPRRGHVGGAIFIPRLDIGAALGHAGRQQADEFFLLGVEQRRLPGRCAGLFQGLRHGRKG